jgi:N-acetylmuramoyl-L-alanine amidase
LGFINRGVKTANFVVLQKTKMPAILVECCFCDSAVDMALFDADLMAEAIAEGILGKDIPSEREVIPQDIFATMTVLNETFLKPSPEDSTKLEPNLLKVVPEGVYQVKVLADDEAHYLIECDLGKGFIYSKHCKVEPLN